MVGVLGEGKGGEVDFLDGGWGRGTGEEGFWDRDDW